MSGKALEPGQNERLRALLTDIVNRDFKGNKTHAAKGLGVSQSFVTEVMAGHRGAGNTLINALADYTGKSTDELRGRTRPRADDVGEGTGIGRVEGWEAAAEECVAQNPWVQPWMIRSAARVSGVDAPSPMTAAYVLEAVQFILRARAIRENAAAARKPTEAAIQKHVRDAGRRATKAKANKTGMLPLDGAAEPKQLPAPARRRSRR